MKCLLLLFMPIISWASLCDSIPKEYFLSLKNGDIDKFHEISTAEFIEGVGDKNEVILFVHQMKKNLVDIEIINEKIIPHGKRFAFQYSKKNQKTQVIENMDGSWLVAEIRDGKCFVTDFINDYFL